MKILSGGFEKIKHRNVGYGMPLRIYVAAGSKQSSNERNRSGNAYRCMVTPHARRSLTLSTLLMTSRPRSSNTSTFHIGSPSAFRIGVDCGMSPFVAGVS